MKLDLALVADHAYYGDGGKLFILGEFRYIRATSVPAVHQSLALVARVLAEKVEVRDGPAKLRLEITDADGNQAIPKPPEMAIKFAPVGPAAPSHVYANIILELNGIPFQHWGDYAFHLWVNGTHIGHAAVSVVKIAAPPAGGSQPKQRAP